MQYRPAQAIVIFLYIIHGSLQARTIYNQTGYPLYVAGYHAANTAERKTSVLEVAAGAFLDLKVPDTGFLSTKTRYIVVARTPDRLEETLSLQGLKELPHKSLTINKLNDFYLADKEGRLKMYNELEHSDIIRSIKEVGSTVKGAIVEVAIDKEKLPAVQNNPHRTEIARVRVDNSLSEGERVYLQKRMPKVKQALERLLKTSLKTKKTPQIAFVMSGGGIRAMYASCGYLLGAQEMGLLDAATYAVGLSGSTWFLGSWFSSGQNNISIFKNSFVKKMRYGIASLNKHDVALISDALKVKVAYGEYITLVDLYGALLANALFADFGDKRHMIYLSDHTRYLANGDWIFPIYTAIDASRQAHQLDKWYECTPYEVGGSWLRHYIPTWAFGRQFSQGVSTTDDPEISLGFMFGIFGSAFAVDVALAWQEIIKNNEKAAMLDAVVAPLILSKIGDRRVSVAEEFNFTAGMSSSALRETKKLLMGDAGLSINVPYPPVSGERSERAPEILIFIDCSAELGNIKTNEDSAFGALRATANYAKKNNLKFPPIDSVKAEAISIYRDENDPTVPLVIWMPLLSDTQRLRSAAKKSGRPMASLDIAECINNSFCATTNFTYKSTEAEQLVELCRLTMLACKNEITEAITWKIDHM